MTAGDMSMLLAIVAGIGLGAFVALALVRGNGEPTEADDDEQARAVSKPAPLDDQFRKGGYL